MENVETKLINTKEMKPFLLDKHYLHRLVPSKFNYGLYYKGELHGVIAYSNNVRISICHQISNFANKENTLELSRLFIDDEVSQTVKNITSYFVSYTLKDLKRFGNYFVISYADSGANHTGAIYQATNFKYYGKTKSGHYCYQGKDKKGGAWKKGKYYRFVIVSSPKYRYITLVGDKKFKKAILKTIKLEELPYPKGDNIHYDANYKEPRYIYDREEQKTYKEDDIDYDLFLRSYEGMGHKGLPHSSEWLLKHNQNDNYIEINTEEDFLKLMNSKAFYSRDSGHIIEFVTDLDKTWEERHKKDPNYKGCLSNGTYIIDDYANMEDDISWVLGIAINGVANMEDWYEEHGAYDDHEKFIKDINNLILPRKGQSNYIHWKYPKDLSEEELTNYHPEDYVEELP